MYWKIQRIFGMPKMQSIFVHGKTATPRTIIGEAILKNKSAETKYTNRNVYIDFFN